MFHVESISEMARLAGMPPPSHPLIGVIRLTEVGMLPAGFPTEVSYGFYCIGFKKHLQGVINYGQTHYDFQEGALGFSRPGQVVSFAPDAAMVAKGWLIYIHADFLHAHPLQQKMKEYGFFDYQVNEGLHVSASEEAMLMGIFNNLEREYQQHIDRFSRELMLANLELLLSYANRFYNRQFITRHQADNSLLKRFETLLKNYYQQSIYTEKGLPSVAYFADALSLSPNYLSGMLRATTGKSTQEHIHLQLIDRSKELLLGGQQLTVAEVAYALGFEYPQYFSRLFKAKTGLSPTIWKRNYEA